MKQKLLIATDSFLPRWDGITRFLMEVIPRIKQDYDITIVCPNFGDLEPIEDVKVERFSTLKATFGTDYNLAVPSYSKLSNLVHETDIIWVQSIGPIGGLTSFIGKKKNKHIIAYNHSIEWELIIRSFDSKGIIRAISASFMKFYARYIYNKANLLMVPSLEIGEILRKAGIKTQKTVVHLGVNTDKFVAHYDKKEAKSVHGLDPDSIVIGFAGRIGKEKDLKTLYRAFVRIKRKYNKAILLLVGQDIAGVTRKYSNDSHIMVVGSVNNIVPYLQAMDVYVLPSLTETTSLSTLEAMSCSTPVIATRVGYVKSYIKDNHNGMFFKKQDSYELYKKLVILIESDTIKKRIGTNARKTVLEQFSWTKTVESIKKVLELY